MAVLMGAAVVAMQAQEQLQRLSPEDGGLMPGDDEYFAPREWMKDAKHVPCPLSELEARERYAARWVGKPELADVKVWGDHGPSVEAMRKLVTPKPSTSFDLMNDFVKATGDGDAPGAVWMAEAERLRTQVLSERKEARERYAYEPLQETVDRIDPHGLIERRKRTLDARHKSKGPTPAFKEHLARERHAEFVRVRDAMAKKAAQISVKQLERMMFVGNPQSDSPSAVLFNYTLNGKYVNPIVHNHEVAKLRSDLGRKGVQY